MQQGEGMTWHQKSHSQTAWSVVILSNSVYTRCIIHERFYSLEKQPVLYHSQSSTGHWQLALNLVFGALKVWQVSQTTANSHDLMLISIETNTSNTIKYLYLFLDAVMMFNASLSGRDKSYFDTSHGNIDTCSLKCGGDIGIEWKGAVTARFILNFLVTSQT